LADEIRNEAVRASEFIPLETFLSMKESVYYKPWVDPWRVIEWGLEVAGLKSRQVGVGKIKEGSFVVVKNVEVCSPSFPYNTVLFFFCFF
jgi:charged multivesicular body protein 7